MKIVKELRSILMVAFGVVVFHSCVGIPRGANVVKPFDSKRYLGKWYEIARMDFRFERGLSRTTAEYSLNEDGSIRVLNRGYDAAKRLWKQAVGKARFVGSSDEARLKVTFFVPFYGGYNVIALDDYYQYALVAGDNLKYLWILSRQTTIPEGIRHAFLRKAREIGFDVDKLIWVIQE